MKNKKDIIKDFERKINILKKNNELYFVNDKPAISDSEYDNIKSEIFRLKKKYSFLKNFKIEEIVGAPPSNKFKKVKHLLPMLSLSNAFKIDDMYDFLKKIRNFLKLKNDKIELISEPKIDGISATLIYEKGKLIKGLSRGDGTTGEDIRKFKTIKNYLKYYQRIFQIYWDS